MTPSVGSRADTPAVPDAGLEGVYDPGVRQTGTPAGGLPLGRPFGIPVHLSWSWVVAAVVITWIFAPVVQERLPTLSDGVSLVVAACFAVLLGLSVLVHELAHSVAALRFGQPVRRITLHLLGGVSEIGSQERSPGRDIVIVAVGPLASLALAGMGAGLVWLLPAGTVLHLVAFQLAIANLVVGVFNLIPGLPLDGGRILQDVVWAATGRQRTGTVVAAWSGRVLAVLLVASALLPLLRGGSTVWLVWGLLLGWFVWAEAGRALVASRVRERLADLSARSLTRRAIPVPDQLSVSEALRRGAEARAGALVGIDVAGRPTRVVSEAAVAALPEQRRPWVTVAQVSRALVPGGTVAANLAGEPLLAWLDEHPAPEYLVVEPDGAVYGVLSREDVQRAVTALATRPGPPRG